MTTNDNILTLMIEKDMLSRKVVSYQIKDEVITNPKQIKVGANEVVYVCYCQVETSGDFKLKLESGTDVVTYHPKNTIQQGAAYHSSQITSHWSNIKIISKSTIDYFIRFIRVTLHKTQINEKS